LILSASIADGAANARNAKSADETHMGRGLASEVERWVGVGNTADSRGGVISCAAELVLPINEQNAVFR
jgi:hypothetical protein